MSANAKALDAARLFILDYYDRFDADRSAASMFYAPECVLTHEGKNTHGSIHAGYVLTSLHMLHCRHTVIHVDAQELSDSRIFLLVDVRVQTDNDPPACRPEAFILEPFNDTFRVANHIFRIRT